VALHVASSTPASGRVLSTQRLELRPLPRAAIDAMWRDDRESLQALTGLRWPEEAPPTLGEHLPHISTRLAASPDEAPWWIWSIAGRHDPRAAGAAGYSGPPDDHGLVYIGYALYPFARARGFATEAVRALTERAFGHRDLCAVLATIDAANVPSRAVAERAGLRFHGRYGEMCAYRITRGQWQAGRR
jgi:RimJ/RimL family protein N-acetyltransferase